MLEARRFKKKGAFGMGAVEKKKGELPRVGAEIKKKEKEIILQKGQLKGVGRIEQFRKCTIKKTE